ncbi:hypothetical protein INR49_005045 [Caranx melampygus]|nr:hypothetical protein INR49_005045 [Caranx melampygus]
MSTHFPVHPKICSMVTPLPESGICPHRRDKTNMRLMLRTSVRGIIETVLLCLGDKCRRSAVHAPSDSHLTHQDFGQEHVAKLLWTPLM